MRRNLLIGAALALAATAAAAHDYNVGRLRVADPWSRPAAMGGSAAGFGAITNTGSTPVTLTGVSSSGSKYAGMHRTVETGGVFSMTDVPSLTLSPGQTVTFAPGGYHMMFMGLKAPLRPGGKLPAVLTFKRGTATMTMPVVFEAR